MIAVITAIGTEKVERSLPLSISGHVIAMTATIAEGLFAATIAIVRKLALSNNEIIFTCIIQHILISTRP